MIGPRWLLVLGFTGMVASPPRAAAAQSPAVASVPSDPTFAALGTDGVVATGRIRQLGEKAGLVLDVGPDGERSVPLDRLVKLTREGASPPPRNEGGGIVVFPEGDRLVRCRVGSSGEAKLDVHSTALENLGIPLDGILGLILEVHGDPDGAEALVARVRSEPRDSEILWLANGDKVPGLLSRIDEKKVAFQPASGRIELDRKGVDAIGFDPKQVDYRRPKGPFFELTLVDGSRLGMSDLRVERGLVIGTTRFLAEIRVPLGELAQVHVLNASVAYLSDREPDRFLYEAYVGPTRPFRRDLSVAGQPLRLGKRTYDRGLGTQSRTLLAYRLEPKARRFQALVGLDDQAGPLGNVAFKVVLDGKTRFESPPMGVGEPPRAVDVDIEGGKVLVLITEFGERGDVQDSADWVEARIVR